MDPAGITVPVPVPKTATFRIILSNAILEFKHAINISGTCCRNKTCESEAEPTTRRL